GRRRVVALDDERARAAPDERDLAVEAAGRERLARLAGAAERERALGRDRRGGGGAKSVGAPGRRRRRGPPPPPACGGRPATWGGGCLRLSTEAAAITSAPTAGAPIVHSPSARLLPAPATTTMPLRTSLEAACAVGACGQPFRSSVRLRFSTSAPSR